MLCYGCWEQVPIFCYNLLKKIGSKSKICKKYCVLGGGHYAKHMRLYKSTQKEVHMLYKGPLKHVYHMYFYGSVTRF